jgi:hypothetical protein
VFPAESETLAAVAPALLHTPVSTTNLLPVVTLAPGVTARLVTFEAWPVACWINAGAGAAAPAVTIRSQAATSVATAKARPRCAAFCVVGAGG